MEEVFIIYNENTGFMDGGCGRIDRAWDGGHKDGSTMTERIAGILAKDKNRAVIYLPDQDLPDPAAHKIEDGKVVGLTEADRAAIEGAKPETEIELLKKRVTALEARIAK